MKKIIAPVLITAASLVFTSVSEKLVNPVLANNLNHKSAGSTSEKSLSNTGSKEKIIHSRNGKNAETKIDPPDEKQSAERTEDPPEVIAEGANKRVIAFTQADLWDNEKVRDVHIRFTDSLWKAMQPYGGLYGINGEDGRWNEGNMLYPTLLKDGDKNYDGILSHEEFMDLGRYWFNSWDTIGNDTLDWGMINNGIKSTLVLSLQGPESNGVARVAGVITPTVEADFQFEGLDYDSASVRYKGNGTLLWAHDNIKKPIKIDLNDGFPGRKLAGSSKLNLHNLEADPSYMNDVIAYQLYRDCGVPAPRTTYARVYMTIPDTLDNKYLGLYLMVENVDDNFARHWYGTKKGEIMKPVTNQLFEYLGDDWTVRYKRTFDPKTSLSIVEKKYLIEICKFVSQAPDEEFHEKLWSYFDLDNFARYFAVTVFISEIDGIMGPRIQNFYFFMDPKTYRLSIIPWDYDHSFGNAWQKLSVEEVNQLSIKKPWIEDNYFLERLFKDEKFNELYRHYLQEFSKSQFQPERIISQVRELTPIIRPSVAKESPERLASFDFTTGWNIKENDPQDSASTKYPVPLRAFIKPRYESVSNQLAGTEEGVITRDDNVLPDGWFGSMIMKITDGNRDGKVPREEFLHQFDSLYTAWGGSSARALTDPEMREGIEHYLASFPEE